MQKAIETNLTYLPGDGRQAVFGVTIYTDPRSNVVVLTEKKDNQGVSVTNAVEHLVQMVERAYPDYFKDGRPVTWVEHYEAHQTFDIVKVTNGKPDWKRISTADFAALVGIVSPNQCNHPNFEMHGRVARLVPDGCDPGDPNIKPDGYDLDLHVCCSSCQVPFHFPGMAMGYGGGPKVNLDATELRIKIKPGALPPVDLTQPEPAATPVPVHNPNPQHN